jgi:ribA/ribD-fused uncharacterized protein
MESQKRSSMKVNQFRGKYRFLSNFYPSRVVLEGEEYQTVEHAYQAAKFPKGSDIREKIRFSLTPGNAKRIGRSGSLDSHWEDRRLSMMQNLVLQKFIKDEELQNMLLETGDMILEEGNNWKDTFWGVDLISGEGENYLGKILMQTRFIIKRMKEG